MREPLVALLAAVPATADPFSGTEYPLPIHLALYGRVPPVTWLADQAGRADTVVAALEPALAMAEAIESVAADRMDYFLPDTKARSLVFMGAKWHAGWALCVGGVTDELVRNVVDRDFLTFCAHPRPTWGRARSRSRGGRRASSTFCSSPCAMA